MVAYIFPLPHPCAIRFPKPNSPASPILFAFTGRSFSSAAPMCQLDFPSQIPTSPISSAFSGRYFSLAASMCQLDFPGQIPTSPVPSAFSGRYFSLAAPMCKGRGLTGALESDSPAHLITDSPAHRIQAHPHNIQTHLRTRHLEREKPTFRFIN